MNYFSINGKIGV